MLTRTKTFSLTIAALLLLTLLPGAPFGLAQDRQGKPTTAAPPESLNTLSITKAHFSGVNAPSAPSVIPADAENVEPMGHIGGLTYAVAVARDRNWLSSEPVMVFVQEEK